MKGGYETPPHSFAIRSPMGNSKQRVYVSPTTTIPFLILLRVRARASRETVAERWIAKIKVDDFYRTAMRGKMFVEILVSRQPSRFRVSREWNAGSPILLTSPQFISNLTISLEDSFYELVRNFHLSCLSTIFRDRI